MVVGLNNRKETLGWCLVRLLSACWCLRCLHCEGFAEDRSLYLALMHEKIDSGPCLSAVHSGDLVRSVVVFVGV